MLAGPASVAEAESFVVANTLLQEAPLVPEIRLHLASEVVPLWQATEEALSQMGLPPPFWAFAWAGGQALARYMLDHPDVVEGRRVLDFASGCGIAAIAAARCDADKVEASEIDGFALAALRLNSMANVVEIVSRDEDLVGRDEGWDIVLAGDICYERELADRVFVWLRTLAARGATVLIGDPGRTYLPKLGLERLIAYSVKTSRELEDSDVRNAVVWRVLPDKGL